MQTRKLSAAEQSQRAREMIDHAQRILGVPGITFGAIEERSARWTEFVGLDHERETLACRLIIRCSLLGGVNGANAYETALSIATEQVRTR